MSLGVRRFALTDGQYFRDSYNLGAAILGDKGRVSQMVAVGVAHQYVIAAYVFGRYGGFRVAG